MITKKNKEQIRQIFREEFAQALTRTLQLERGPGQQRGLQEKRVVEEQWNLIDFITGYIPHLEGAIRGMQETTDLLKNNVDQSTQRVDAVGRTLIGMEESAKQIALLSDFLKEWGLPEAPRRKLIEVKKRGKVIEVKKP